MTDDPGWDITCPAVGQGRPAFLVWAHLRAHLRGHRAPGGQVTAELPLFVGEAEWSSKGRVWI